MHRIFCFGFSTEQTAYIINPGKKAQQSNKNTHTHTKKRQKTPKQWGKRST